MNHSDDKTHGLLNKSQEGSRRNRRRQSETSLNTRIYDLPNLSNVSNRVLCKLFTVSIVCFIFLCAEVVGGLFAQSLAILSDAAHMFSDLSGYFISIFSIWIGQRPANSKMSYGYHRSEVIGALGSILIIWALTVVLVYEATMRIVNRSMVDQPLIMVITAGFGLFCNLVIAWVLHSSPAQGIEPPMPEKSKVSDNSSFAVAIAEEKNGKAKTSEKNLDRSFPSPRKQDTKPNEQSDPIARSLSISQNDEVENNNGSFAKKQKKAAKKKTKAAVANLAKQSESDNYNIRAAMIHVIGDVIQALGVLLAALLIYFFGNVRDENQHVVWTNWQYSDPICTYAFSIMVLATTFGVATECIEVLMEGTPVGIESDDFLQGLKEIQGVKEVHDFHIWSLSAGKPAMSAHIVCHEKPEVVLRYATKLCRKQGIFHSTIQVEEAKHVGQPDYIRCLHNLHE